MLKFLLDEDPALPSASAYSEIDDELIAETNSEGPVAEGDAAVSDVIPDAAAPAADPPPVEKGHQDRVGFEGNSPRQRPEGLVARMEGLVPEAFSELVRSEDRLHPAL